MVSVDTPTVVDVTVAASGALPELSGPASMAVCQFVCRDGETAFPLTKSVDTEAALDPAQLEGLHSEACAVLMAAPDPASDWRCMISSQS
jgi:hypothetical protein